ncbi:peroxisomal leader peptide-processing protease [Pholidichthys leucotaenia]
MELAGVERCCCVVSVSDVFSSGKAASFSGVIVHPPTGTIICTGLPFSRFLTDADPPGLEHGFLPSHSFSDKLKIHVSYHTRHRLNTSRKQSVLQSEAGAELLMLVNCTELKQAFRTVFQDADQWRFHADEEDQVLLRDAQFLSWFAILRSDVAVHHSGPDSGSIPWLSSSSLQKGCPVVACGSPFGSLCLDLFSGTLSRGIISNLAGEDNTVILTDARCLPGTEGGGLFVVKGADTVYLTGVIVSPFGWKANEWVGLTLVCSVHAIFKTVTRCMRAGGGLRGVGLTPEESGLCMSATAQGSKAIKHPTVCFVDSGHFWGSGVVVSSQLVVTCRHVVSGKSAVALKFHHRGRVCEVVGEVLFSTKETSPYDLALVKLKDPVPEAVIPQMSYHFFPGESVVVVGYGGLGRCCGPSLTCGVLSKVISWSDQPVMLQTTCAVQAGTSGGAVMRRCSGELLGIVSSNTRDLAAKVTYPHLNYSVPVMVFQRLLQQFNQTKDANVFRELDTTEHEVKRVWRLQAAQSKL